MEDWYPGKVNVGRQGTPGTYRFMQTCFQPEQVLVYAELGIYQGDTARHVAELFPNAELHLFDFDTAISKARAKLGDLPNQIHFHANTQRFNDSYNWALIKLIEAGGGRPIFDYCFLDGAHTVAVDALSFFLCDRLLRVGGYMDFDDYGWRLRGSSLDPTKVPAIASQYTDEQIDAYQVRMIVDLLVRPDGRYREVVQDKIFQKVA